MSDMRAQNTRIGERWLSEARQVAERQGDEAGEAVVMEAAKPATVKLVDLLPLDVIAGLANWAMHLPRNRAAA